MSEPARWVKDGLSSQSRSLPTEVDLIRRCSKVDKYFGSRYIFDEGIWKYGAAIIIDSNVVQNAYRNGSEYIISWNDLDEERCPLCGVIGTVVQCSHCKFICCRGRTTAEGLFRCRDACGHSGWVRPATFTNRGIAL
jgi:hypothetical protein